MKVTINKKTIKENYDGIRMMQNAYDKAHPTGDDYEPIDPDEAIRMQKDAYMKAHGVEDDDFYYESDEDWFGIKGAKFIYHGEWADPEVIYDGVTLNYYDIESWLLDIYRDDNPSDKNDEGFDAWMEDPKNKATIQSVLDELVQSKEDKDSYNVDDKEEYDESKDDFSSVVDYISTLPEIDDCAFFSWGDFEYNEEDDCIEVYCANSQESSDWSGSFGLAQEEFQSTVDCWAEKITKECPGFKAEVECDGDEGTIFIYKEMLDESWLGDKAKDGWNKVKDGAKKLGKKIGDAFNGPFRKGDHIVMSGEDGEKVKGTIIDWDLSDKTYKVLLGKDAAESSRDDMVKSNSCKELKWKCQDCWEHGFGDCDDCDIKDDLKLRSDRAKRKMAKKLAKTIGD